MLDKQRLLDALIAEMERDLATATLAQKATQAGATHEESKPENDKDTRALESSYLARGQAERVATLREALGELRAMNLRVFSDESPIALTALVTLDDGDQERLVFLAPAGGGIRLPSDRGEVRVVTPTSPLGRAILGCRVGDDFDFATPSGTRTYSVTAVR